MKAARDANDHEAMLAAVRINWRLWTILQAELLDPSCTVPMEIRTNVLSLAQFVDKHSVDILGKPSPKQLDVLISINRELAGGLFTTPQPPNRQAGDGVSSPKKGNSDGFVDDASCERSRFADGGSAREQLRIST
jgi:flagellar protein FlaF